MWQLRHNFLKRPINMGRQSKPGAISIEWNPLIDKDTIQNQRVAACRNRKSRTIVSEHTVQDTL
jgi:ubiquinone biosynthesis protein Coq4